MDKKRIHIILGALAVTLVLVGFVASSSAATLYVGGPGNYTTIQGGDQ